MSPAAEPARAGRARLLAAGGGLLLTTVFWGSAVPFNLVLLRELDPFVLTAARMALSVAILAAFVAWREQGPLLVLPTSWLRFALLGVEPTWPQLLGRLVVLAGVLYMQLARLRAAPA